MTDLAQLERELRQLRADLDALGERIRLLVYELSEQRFAWERRVIEAMRPPEKVASIAALIDEYAPADVGDES